MTQETIMKRRMIRAIVLFLAAFIAMLIFIGLYVDEKRRVQETYRTQFNTHMQSAVSAVDSYLNAEGDFPLRYRVILSHISGANSFAFLMTGLTEEQKIAVNELQTVFLKYPEQMQETERLEAVRQACQDISENLDKGFEEASAVVDAVDKKGY